MLMPSRALRPLLLRLCLAQALLVAGGCHPSTSASPGANPKVPAGAKSSGGLHASIATDKGSIVIEFLPSDAPKAVENFRLLAEHGYYDGLTIHRIVRGFMIQGGDPAGDGSGGDSAWGGTFADEIQKDSPLYQAGYKRGIVAMANSGPNTNTSQFFIMLRDYPLPPSYVIFARVTGGMEVVDGIGDMPVTAGSDGEVSKPVNPPVLRRVTILP
jgi:cyclophilin family peptidyl-prolyl cis-trans isomerase